MDEKNKLVVFQDKKIRRIWHNGEWYFSVIDIVQVLTDSNNPRNYWSMLKKREQDVGIELSTNCVQLKLEAPDGKLRETDCANTKSIFRNCFQIRKSSIFWGNYSRLFRIFFSKKSPQDILRGSS